MTSDSTHPGPGPMTPHEALTLASQHHQAGRFQQAEPLYRQIIQAAPGEPNALHLLGVLCHQTGRSDEAAGLIRRALTAQPDFADAHANLAKVLASQGLPQEAIAAWQKVIRLRPDSAEAHFNLGATLAGLRQNDQAVLAYRQAVRVQPAYVEAWTNLGNLLWADHQHDQAVDCFRRAAELAPDLVAPRRNLGRLLEELGQFDQARDWYRQVLAIDPHNAGAMYQLAIGLKRKLPPEDIARMQEALAAGAASQADQAVLHWALAAVLDAQGHYAPAASHTRQAGALEKDLAAREGRVYHPEDFARTVDRLIEIFTPEFIGKARRAAPEAARAVFVVGMPRSGTTLIEQILASHPDVHGAGELESLRPTLALVPQAMGRNEDPLACLADLTGPAAEHLAREFLQRLADVNADALRVVDKTPDNYLHVGLIAVLLGGAKIIHSRRDLRDVAVSCWLTSFADLPWTCDPDWIADRIAQYRRLMAHWRRVAGEAMLEVDYEQIVGDFEARARRLVEWVGLPWDPACLEFHRRRGPVQSASMHQVRRPVYSGSVGRWRNYQGELDEMFRKIQADLDCSD
jgi:tetratricopeptide (TPR) repeat protein